MEKAGLNSLSVPFYKDWVGIYMSWALQEHHEIWIGDCVLISHRSRHRIDPDTKEWHPETGIEA